MTRASVAARVRAEKAAHPERFCSFPGCLWRVVRQDGRVTPCGVSSHQERMAHPEALAEVQRLRALVSKAADHVAEMGCTCVDRSQGHEALCVGWDIAQELIADAGRRAGAGGGPCR